jgi:hypothetical protein
MDKRLVYAFLAGLAFAWWMSFGSSPLPTPFNPNPEPSRPVLRLIAKVAKNALWFMLIAEPQPEPAERQMVQHVVGDDGFPVIDHARAF